MRKGTKLLFDAKGSTIMIEEYTDQTGYIDTQTSINCKTEGTGVAELQMSLKNKRFPHLSKPSSQASITSRSPY